MQQKHPQQVAQEYQETFLNKKSKKTTCRKDSGECPGLVNMASYWLYRQEDKEMMVTQDKEHNIRTEMYSLEIMTSYFLLEGTKAQTVLIRGVALVIASSNTTQSRS